MGNAVLRCAARPSVTIVLSRMLTACATGDSDSSASGPSQSALVRGKLAFDYLTHRHAVAVGGGAGRFRGAQRVKYGSGRQDFRQNYGHVLTRHPDQVKRHGRAVISREF